MQGPGERKPSEAPHTSWLLDGNVALSRNHTWARDNHAVMQQMPTAKFKGTQASETCARFRKPGLWLEGALIGTGVGEQAHTYSLGGWSVLGLLSNHPSLLCSTMQPLHKQAESKLKVATVLARPWTGAQQYEGNPATLNFSTLLRTRRSLLFSNGLSDSRAACCETARPWLSAKVGKATLSP